jgi:hypothetical protein
VSRVQFDYYMHDSYEHTERIEQIAESAGISIDDDLADKIGKPFYEIALSCTLDTETGEVEITGAASVR